MLDPSKLPAVQQDVVTMQGGMDEMTPMLRLPTGMVRSALNFECSILGGYSRIGGYERYDGHTAPSATVYVLVSVTAYINIPSAGQVLTGATSGATGTILFVDTQRIVLAGITGVFLDGETLQVGTTVIGVKATGGGGVTGKENAQYSALAANFQRANISAVPGSGSVLGVFVYNDIVYAFRNNSGGAAALLYQSSAAGWVNIPFLYQVYFTAGSVIPTEGSTITQGGVTATIKRVVTQASTLAWSGGTAVGKLIISAPAGGNFAAGVATYTGGSVTLSGVQTAITMNPGGKFSVVIGNFSGQTATTRAYGCDGQNKCWEFDGNIFVPIDTGFTPDTPTHIAIHKGFLFIGIQASLGFCAPGLPYDWTAISGAGTLAIGDTLTNMLELPGAQTTAAMGVWGRKTTYILYGTGASSWNLVPLNTGCGALPYTAQNMAHTYVFDDRGVIDMEQTLNYGNFDIDTITYRINNQIALKRTLVVGTALNRQFSQYRVFCSDGSGFYITNLHGDYAWQNVASGAMPILFPNPVNVIFETKLSNGSEATYFGSTNGFVYQLDMGTSFDGVAINSYLNFGPNHVSSPRTRKRFRRCTLDVTGLEYFEYQFGYALSYGSADSIQPNLATYSDSVSIPQWDNFIWDNFAWDGANIIPEEVDMNGTSTNYAIAIKSNSDIFQKFTINSAITSYSNRRMQR